MHYKKFLITILFLTCRSYIFSQKLSYQFPEKFYSFYDFKPDTAYKIIANQAKVNKELIEEDRINKIYNIQYNFDVNNVYMGWNEPEKYLVNLLDTLIPDTFPDKKYLTLFIERDPNYNAAATSTGLFYINIGLLAKVRNEAVLANIISHECGHYLLKHHQKSINDYKTAKESSNSNAFRNYMNKSQKYELEADYFAALAVTKIGYDLKYVAQEFDYMDMKDRIYNYSRGYKNMVKASEQGEGYVFKKKINNGFSTHPLSSERLLMVNKIKEKNNGKEKYVLDSIMFTRLRKIAREECKKIYYDKANYNSCLEIAFIDYLYEPKNIKNIYYIIESLRRFLYINPQKGKDPFLTENIDDDQMFYNRQSVLYKPDYIFSDYEEYEELKNHELFVIEKKPFNTYEEALFFFTSQAKKMNFNEVNLSLALHYYGQKKIDSVNYYLTEYLKPENGLNKEFAQNLLKNGAPTIPNGKSVYVVDNIGCYNYTRFSYFISKSRKKFNPQIKSTLLNSPDVNQKIDIVLMNELMGNKPKDLFEYQRLSSCVTNLFTEEDIFNFKKKRLSSRETQEEFSLSHKFNKHLFILAPEYYNWFLEKGYSKLLFIESVHQFESGLEPKEIYNTYTGYYLDINAIRPYFKDATRNGFNRLQKNEEIYKDIADFLYNKE